MGKTTRLVRFISSGQPTIIGRNRYLASGTSQLWQGRGVTFMPAPAGRRYASTTTAPDGVINRLKNIALGTSLILGFTFIYIYITDTRASAHKWLVIPAFRLMYPDPEEAHEVGNQVLKALWQFGLYPRERDDRDASGDLQVEVFGHTLRSPIGTSAGIDKHADIPDPLLAIGPAIIELGGATPMPQDGNDKPRVFRLPSQNALINRYGLNSEGADHVAMRLRRRVREFAYAKGYGHDDAAEQFVLDGRAGVPPGSLTPGKLMAVNIAKNKTTPEDNIQAVTDDYVYCVERLAPYADILVVNVSSPNTPGLRTLQHVDSLTKILQGVVTAAHQTARQTRPAVMVKVSPDEDSEEQVAGICEAVWKSGVDGVIVGNTTTRRPQSLPRLRKLSMTEQQHLLEKGGFSGPHLFDRTVALVKRYRDRLDHRSGKYEANVPSPEPTAAAEKKLDRVTASVDSGVIPASNPSAKAESEKQPLFNAPKERLFDQASEERVQIKSSPTPENTQPRPARKRAGSEEPKVIFATGGITNGKQALEVLNAGASVAMVYTALVYGGVGTISRIKDEMREAMKLTHPKQP